MRKRRRLYGLIGVGVALPATLAAGMAIAAGGGTPANKVVAAGDTAEVAGPGEEVTLLSATMKTSKPTDLLIHTAAECTILTGLITNNTDKSSTASGRVHVWIEFDGKVVPIQAVSSPPQNGATPEVGDKDIDGAVFCDREYSRTVEDQEDDDDGLDETDDYIRTKSAHGFNWVRMNTGSGTHTIEMMATLTQTTSGNATAEAIIGNRTMIIEPTKMANNAVIGSGTN